MYEQMTHGHIIHLCSIDISFYDAQNNIEIGLAIVAIKACQNVNSKNDFNPNDKTNSVFCCWVR